MESGMILFLPRTLTVEITINPDGGPDTALLEAAKHKGFTLAEGGCDLEVRPAHGAVKFRSLQQKITIEIELALLTKEPKHE
jgi:hypothetical protein